jgi:hypothetical protein
MKYLFDIICVVIVAAVAFFSAQRPTLDLNFRPSTDVKGQLRDVKKAEKEGVQKEIVEEVVTLGALKERNIFSPYGSYTISGASLEGPLPQNQNPYSLIGILQGEEKKAVFRDYKGSIITLAVGKKLVDGSVITRIDRLSVVVERGNEKRELKVFDLANPARRTPPKPERGPLQRR